MSTPRKRPRPPEGNEDGRPRYALPSDLARSLRHLEDSQLDRLLGAVVEEARRRGLASSEKLHSSLRAGATKGPGKMPETGKRAKDRALPISPGQEQVIRAAFEAGVKPGTIARQFRVSRAQVESIVGGSRRGSR